MRRASFGKVAPGKGFESFWQKILGKLLARGSCKNFRQRSMAEALAGAHHG